jgi:RHH-type proline utilization regulon transcriptional repressor/proline dehydrogenase/delta 1-pyrroline-5-carboxylate dehydrogenase
MSNGALEREIQALGRAIFAKMENQSPSVFQKDWWSGKLLDWCMKDEAFKIEMFRFVDVFPVLRGHEEVARHIREYFLRPEQSFGFLGAGMGLASSALGARMGAAFIEKNILSMAKRFIAGANPEEAFPHLAELRQEGLAFTVDLLGEATVSESEAQAYLRRYLDLIEVLSRQAREWPENERLDRDAWGPIPRVNVSVKVSALYSQIDPLDIEGSAAVLKDRIRTLFTRAREKGAFVNLDIETYALKELTFRVFREILEENALADWGGAGLAIQCYLKDAEEDVRELLKWAKKRKAPLTFRLVKGAYWDYETVIARQKGWPIPVFENKYETDASYEACTSLVLENHRHVRLACASHNVRSLAHAIAYARKLGLADSAYELQMLFGMAEPIKAAVRGMGMRVRDYVPVGELIPGMGYFVRRLLENTSNESFLRQRFAEGGSAEDLLRSPEEWAKRKAREAPKAEKSEGLAPFANEPYADFSREENRAAMRKAMVSVHKGLGAEYPAVINGREVRTGDILRSVNPCRPSEVVGTVPLVGAAEAEEAVAAARRAFPAWRDTPAEKRAEYLLRAAEYLRKRRYEMSAVMVYEAGKTWREADGDVTEAIDFLEYYAREAIRLAEKRRMGRAPGEQNYLFYEPRGLAAVLAPWNFPMAILCGMTSGALAAGNCALMKPARQTPIIAARLMEAFRAAKIPDGVVQFLPSRGAQVGELLASHKDVDFIAFTGSMDVGLHLIEVAGKTVPGQRNVKRVISEMGGKNAAIIDSDADLDEAVSGVVYAAFGYQGQKCSATSRAIVVADAYDTFVARLVEATRSLKVGPSDDPAVKVAAVIDEPAQKSILGYIEKGKEEAKLAIQADVPQGGYYVGPTIFVDVPPNAVIAQQEIFGPVLSVMRAESFEEALEIANGTAYALTGGLYSRSPARIAQACREFRVGNLYINRGTSGALVERQPFGGSRMSGVGSKAGGPDYLMQFLEPRVTTENTMRRGFAPTED